MTEKNRLQEIKQRLQSNAYFINPHSDANVADDIKYLLGLVETLEKKNEVLSTHVAELTTEMENVKSDFGNSR